MAATSEPLKKQRLVALALTWAWFVVSASVGLNALIKFASFRISMDSNLLDLFLGATRERHVYESSPPQASLSNFISMVSTSLLCCHIWSIFIFAQISINLVSFLHPSVRLWPSSSQCSSSSRSSGQSAPPTHSRSKRGY